MTYSRWSNDSNWLSFYRLVGGDTKGTQVLALWHYDALDLIDWTYDDLKSLKTFTQEEITKSLVHRYSIKDGIDKDVREALTYIDKFLLDVEDEFGATALSK